MSRFKIVLRYQNKEYVLFDECKYRDGLEFNWTEGNYSCDCNRSLFIKRQCDPDFPKMECGETIELVSLEEVKE